MLFFCEVFWFLILRIEMSMANLKKQQQTRERPTQGRRRGGGGHSFITEMAVFSLEATYSCEPDGLSVW